MEGRHAKKITTRAESSTKNCQREVGISNSLQSKPTLVLIPGGKLEDSSYIGLAGKNLEPIVSTYSCSLLTTASESNGFAAIDRFSVRRTPFSFWAIPEESSRFMLSLTLGRAMQTVYGEDTTSPIPCPDFIVCRPTYPSSFITHCLLFQITLHESRFSHNYW